MGSAIAGWSPGTWISLNLCCLYLRKAQCVSETFLKLARINLQTLNSSVDIIKAQFQTELGSVDRVLFENDVTPKAWPQWSLCQMPIVRGMCHDPQVPRTPQPLVSMLHPPPRSCHLLVDWAFSLCLDSPILSQALWGNFILTYLDSSLLYGSHL